MFRLLLAFVIVGGLVHACTDDPPKAHTKATPPQQMASAAPAAAPAKHEMTEAELAQQKRNDEFIRKWKTGEALDEEMKDYTWVMDMWEGDCVQGMDGVRTPSDARWVQMRAMGGHVDESVLKIQKVYLRPGSPTLIVALQAGQNKWATLTCSSAPIMIATNTISTDRPLPR